MTTLSVTLGALASAAFAQSAASAAPPAADARASNRHIHLFTQDPEVQRNFWVAARQ